MNHSENIDLITKALIEFQSNVGQIEKSATVDVYKDKKKIYDFNYAPLDKIIEQCQPVLNKNGLSVIQLLCDTSGVETVILHNSGQYLSSKYQLQNNPTGKPQDIGSLITYARRYAYCAALGIVTEEDDDGNRSQDQYTKPKNDKPWLNPNDENWNNCLKALKQSSFTIEDIKKKYLISEKTQELLINESKA